MQYMVETARYIKERLKKSIKIYLLGTIYVIQLCAIQRKIKIILFSWQIGRVCIKVHIKRLTMFHPNLNYFLNRLKNTILTQLIYQICYLFNP